MASGRVGRDPSARRPARRIEPIESSCVVEFFGPARLAAGAREVAVPLRSPLPLSQLLPLLAERCPAIVGTILAADRARLAEGFQINLNGRDFLGRRDAVIQPGDRLLVLVSSAGG